MDDFSVAAEVAFVVAAAWGIAISAWFVLASLRKGHSAYGRIGALGIPGQIALLLSLIGLVSQSTEVRIALGVIAALSLFAVWGSIRLAKPTSTWARSRYNSEFMARSVARYRDEAGDQSPLPKPVVSKSAETVVQVLLVVSVVVVILLAAQVDNATQAALPLLAISGNVAIIGALAEVELTGVAR